jgi:hypothetical protein
MDSIERMLCWERQKFLGNEDFSWTHSIAKCHEQQHLDCGVFTAGHALLLSLGHTGPLSFDNCHVKKMQCLMAYVLVKQSADAVGFGYCPSCLSWYTNDLEMDVVCCNGCAMFTHTGCLQEGALDDKPFYCIECRKWITAGPS